MKRALIVFLLSFSPFLFAQSPSSMVVTTQWLAARLGRPDIVVVQVGPDRRSYDAGHIPGARFLALSDIAVTRDGIPNELPSTEQLLKAFAAAGVGDGKRAVLYSDEANLFAARAWWTLDYLGHAADAALLDGSIQNWRSENRPLTQEVPPPVSITLTARLHRNVLATASTVAGVVSTSASGASRGVRLVDARPPEQYSGAQPDSGLARTGHIPGAVNIPWSSAFESKQDPRLLPVPDLRKMFRDAGLPGARLIVYCRSGILASSVFFTARFLGYDAAVYDGSFFEWSNDPRDPVEKASPAH